MSSSITNTGDNTLSSNLKSILPNCDKVDALVGYFYFSGFRDLHNELKDKQIRILVGMDIDKKIIDKVSTLKDLNLDSYTTDTKTSSRSIAKDDYIENFSRIFNDTDFFDNDESQKAFEIFFSQADETKELNIYKIEHKILTLTTCAVMEDKNNLTSFEIDGVKFSHWEFNYRDGWTNDAWLATAEISAESFLDALNELARKLSKLISRISLISQSYIEYINEPFLIHKKGSDVFFFRYVADAHVGGLMFMENEQKALNQLLNNKNVPEPFYYYWNDAINASGYSAKLLLMFSAIESLVKDNGKKNWNLTNEILGKDLVKELFGTKENSNTGLRHRLVHGEYFGNLDHGKNYLELVHNKVISYFNKKVLDEKLILENIVNPQRNLFGNKEQENFFLKGKVEHRDLNLKEVLKDFDENRPILPQNYEIIYDKNLVNVY